MMRILAADFSGMAPLVLMVPVLFALAVASFVPSARGHWSGPALAAPLALATSAFILLQGTVDLGAVVWSVLLFPLAVAAASVALWVARRGSRAA